VHIAHGVAPFDWSIPFSRFEFRIKSSEIGSKFKKS
jgi:hypothetical protein